MPIYNYICNKYEYTYVLVEQMKELTRLEFNDISDRYGELVGPRKFPSVFLVAIINKEIIGYVHKYICMYVCMF
jgi:hypothetical protein